MPQGTAEAGATQEQKDPSFSWNQSGSWINLAGEKLGGLGYSSWKSIPMSKVKMK